MLVCSAPPVGAGVGVCPAAGAIFPDQVSGRRVQRLNDAARVRQVHDAVVHEWRRLLRTRIVHRPGPGELKLLDVLPVDLIERAVAPRVVGASPVQPVAGRRVAQHGFGDRAELPHLTVQPKASHQHRYGNRNDEAHPHTASCADASATCQRAAECPVRFPGRCSPGAPCRGRGTGSV